jgi:hypothetical protein
MISTKSHTNLEVVNDSEVAEKWENVFDLHKVGFVKEIDSFLDVILIFDHMTRNPKPKTLRQRLVILHLIWKTAEAKERSECKKERNGVEFSYTPTPHF